MKLSASLKKVYDLFTKSDCSLLMYNVTYCLRYPSKSTSLIDPRLDHVFLRAEKRLQYHQRLYPRTFKIVAVTVVESPLFSHLFLPA